MEHEPGKFSGSPRDTFLLVGNSGTITAKLYPQPLAKEACPQEGKEIQSLEPNQGA